MDEKDILTGENDMLSQEDTTQPEPQQENAEELEQQKAMQERMEKIFQSVGAGKNDSVPEPIETEREEQLSEPETEAPRAKEIELMTVEKMTAPQKRALVKQQQVEEQKEKTKKVMKKLLVAVLMIAAVIMGGGLYADYMPNNQTGEVVITIPEGAGTVHIAQILKRDNLIGSELFFRIMSKLQGVDGEYNSGKFKVDKSSGYQELFHLLTQSGQNVDAIKVTIPEGYEIYKMADLLEEKGLIDKDKFYYLVQNGEFDYGFLADIPARENRLEGYLYPSTYEFAPGDEYGIINEMLMQFEKMYAKYQGRAEAMGMTMDEAVTLASIIEREALGNEDRKLVSSVFHNRLSSRDYPYLQSCATVQYVLKERKAVLSVDDTKIDSPYNTYINKGLPIGPIASPGEASIEAALYPAESNYLFFVLGSDGKHHFAATYKEHMRNKNNG